MKSGQIYIYPEDISEFEGITIDSARRKLRRIRKFYERKGRKKILISEYCEYQGFTVDEFLKNIRLTK